MNLKKPAQDAKRRLLGLKIVHYTPSGVWLNHIYCADCKETYSIKSLIRNHEYFSTTKDSDKIMQTGLIWCTGKTCKANAEASAADRAYKHIHGLRVSTIIVEDTLVDKRRKKR
jgi:hypothetical protein